MYKDTLSLFCGDFDEIKDVLCRFIVLIKENLTFNILPKEGQVYDAKSFPLILDLFARAVNYP